MMGNRSHFGMSFNRVSSRPTACPRLGESDGDGLLFALPLVVTPKACRDALGSWPAHVVLPAELLESQIGASARVELAAQCTVTCGRRVGVMQVVPPTHPSITP